MRSKTLAALLALLALTSLATACGDDDSSGDAGSASASASGSGSTATESDEEAGHPLSKADLTAGVEAAQLEEEDLGEGWTLTETKPAGEDDDEPNPVDDCFGGLDATVEEATVAESDERTFERQGEGPVPSQVTSSSIGVDDAGVFDEMHELLRSEDFATCLGEGFEEAVAESAEGAEVTLGEIEQEEGVVDPGDDEELESTGLTMPLSIEVAGQKVETTVRMTVLSTGQLGSILIAIGYDDETAPESLAEWGRILAGRLVGG